MSLCHVIHPSTARKSIRIKASGSPEIADRRCEYLAGTGLVAPTADLASLVAEIGAGSDSPGTAARAICELVHAEVSYTRGSTSVMTHAAEAWEQRNREAFLAGYLPKARAAGVLPADETSMAVVLAAFETEKALYELGYEQAHRPEWARIPLAALRRLSAA